MPRSSTGDRGDSSYRNAPIVTGRRFDQGLNPLSRVVASCDRIDYCIHMNNTTRPGATKRELTALVRQAIETAGYAAGDVYTWSRRQNGHDHTYVTRPHVDIAAYLSGYLGNDATVTAHPVTGTITIEWR